MTAVTTDQPVVDGGIASVNFFNGRLLTGEDLTREQTAAALARLRLGRAVGNGVACGLTVTTAPSSTPGRPVVHVDPGSAISPAGRVLELAASVELGLTRTPAAAGDPGDLAFRDCAPPQPGVTGPGSGIYLLTIGPASTPVGRAPASGPSGDAACAVAYTVEGVVFALLRLTLPAAVTADPRLLRNRLAHHAIGTTDPRRTAAVADPLGPAPAGYGLLDDLRAAACLGPEQVPLAVLTWTAVDGIGFVDGWAVRRRVTAPPVDSALPLLTGDRVLAEAEATSQQFHTQVADAVAAGRVTSAVTAAAWFAHLPPVALVPVTRSDGTGPGFDPDAFLGAQATREIGLLDAAQLPALVREARVYPPVAVGGPVRVQRYLVRENDAAAVAGSPVRRVLVLASVALPYRGVARYGYAHFGHDRYARA